MTNISLFRRFSSIFYDALLLFCVLFFITYALIPFREGNAIESENLLFQCFLIFVSYLYFCWHWVHGGQTLGMKAWRIKIIDETGKPCGWGKCSIRFVCSFLSWFLFGAGFFMSFLRQDKCCLHDLLSKTRLVLQTHDN